MVSGSKKFIYEKMPVAFECAVGWLIANSHI